MGGVHTLIEQDFVAKGSQDASCCVRMARGVSAPLWLLRALGRRIYLHLSQGFPNPLTIRLILSVICGLLMKQV